MSDLKIALPILSQSIGSESINAAIAAELARIGGIPEEIYGVGSEKSKQPCRPVHDVAAFYGLDC